MTELVPAGGVPAILPPEAAERDTRLAHLTTMWIERLPSANSRRAYTRDLKMWLAWCERLRIHPLDARMYHMDAWIAHQREHGTGATVGTGSKSSLKVDHETLLELYRAWKAGEATQQALADQVGVTRSALGNRFKWLEEGGFKARTASPASPASIARRARAISSWYEYLIRNTAADPQPLITHNPAKTDAVPKIDRTFSPTVGLARTEADRLIHAADEDSLRASAIIRLLLTNAYRVSVITNANIGDLGHDRGHRTIAVTLKGDKPAADALPPPTAAAIDAYLASRGNPEEGPLFVTRTGGRMFEPDVFDLLRRLATEAGIDSAGKLSPHSLRHTAITELLEATNGNITLAQDFAHHAGPGTTQTYNRRRGQLDGHGAYVLATRYTGDPDTPVARCAICSRDLPAVENAQAVLNEHYKQAHPDVLKRGTKGLLDKGSRGGRGLRRNSEPDGKEAAQ